MNSYLKELKSQLESYTSVDLSGGDDEAKVLELKLKALILVENIYRCFVSNTVGIFVGFEV